MSKQIITGEMDGEVIWRDETVYDKICHLCEGKKLVGGHAPKDEEDIKVPCPECCKGFYEENDMTPEDTDE